ncbi:hypothetical protein DPMN_043411 [Dreissena polymorpha]|uniref:Uncharacterized protein n=1 Tax=Dreissena polymorpha TaxID=45954 RepID=A0A9D4HXX6_DREPO|nr:hypothetical protein DPMN_043411 [Dreissena polymorpha]
MGGIQMTGTEEVMNQIYLVIVDDSACASRYKGYMPNNKLCAGYENQHKNFCWVWRPRVESAYSLISLACLRT